MIFFCGCEELERKHAREAHAHNIPSPLLCVCSPHARAPLPPRGRPTMRPNPRPALALAAVWLAAGVAAAEPLRVSTAAELRSAFEDQSVDSVLLTRSLVLAGDKTWQKAFPAVVKTGRALVIRSADVEAPVTVNMSGSSRPSIYVEPNASLALADAVWVGAKPPPPDKPGSVAEWPAVPDLGLWPGISLAPGSEFGLSNVTMYVFGGCDAIGQCLRETPGRTGIARGAQTVVPAGKGVELLLRVGFVECGVPLIANRTEPGKGKGKCGMVCVCECVCVCV